MLPSPQEVVFCSAPAAQPQPSHPSVLRYLAHWVGLADLTAGGWSSNPHPLRKPIHFYRTAIGGGAVIIRSRWPARHRAMTNGRPAEGMPTGAPSRTIGAPTARRLSA
jgi:hypothetical protein